VSAPTNHWKLGLFVVVGVLIGLLSVLLLGARSLRKETVMYTSYFDEAVTGLEAGSPVSFRGVKVGYVSAVDVAPDHRHVEIRYDLYVAVLSRLKLAKRAGKDTKMPVSFDLRVQINSTGLTGTKFLQIDFFDSANMRPAPELPFPVPENYIPATPSTMKNLEEAVVRAVDQLPAITQAVNEMLTQMATLVNDFHGKNLPDKVVVTLNNANHLLVGLRNKVDSLDLEGLSGETSATLGNVSATLARMQQVLDRVDGEQGLIASLQRTADSTSDLTRGARNVGPELSETLRDVRETVVTLRQLLEALDRDPDMLLKGKAKSQ